MGNDLDDENLALWHLVLKADNSCNPEVDNQLRNEFQLRILMREQIAFNAGRENSGIQSCECCGEHVDWDWVDYADWQKCRKRKKSVCA